MRLETITIRPIQSKDDRRMAQILRDALVEHDAAKPGTAYFDSSTDALTAFFEVSNAGYFVAEINDVIVGGVGIYPTEGLPSGVCELVKMYIDAAYRGKGIGQQLIAHATAFAQHVGYSEIYLESMPELQKAVSIYEHLGFMHLDKPLGNTGHFSCPIWMIKSIQPLGN